MFFLNSSNNIIRFSDLEIVILKPVLKVIALIIDIIINVNTMCARAI